MDNLTTSDDVIAFLKENPNFLQKNPEALDFLVPPKTDKGVADFRSYMIERLKSDKVDAFETTKAIVETSRENMNNQRRIHAAVLRILEADTFDEFIQCITVDLVSILAVDIGVLVVEASGPDIPRVYTNGIRIVPEGCLNQWMNDKDILLQNNIGGIEAIYGGGAALVASQILLRIDISMKTPPAILAFGSRDPNLFHEGQATDQVLFLARVIERCFRMWLHLEAQ